MLCSQAVVTRACDHRVSIILVAVKGPSVMRMVADGCAESYPPVSGVVVPASMVLLFIGICSMTWCLPKSIEPESMEATLGTCTSIDICIFCVFRFLGAKTRQRASFSCKYHNLRAGLQFLSSI